MATSSERARTAMQLASCAVAVAAPARGAALVPAALLQSESDGPAFSWDAVLTPTDNTPRHTASTIHAANRSAPHIIAASSLCDGTTLEQWTSHSLAAWAAHCRIDATPAKTCTARMCPPFHESLAGRSRDYVKATDTIEQALHALGDAVPFVFDEPHGASAEHKPDLAVAGRAGVESQQEDAQQQLLDVELATYRHHRRALRQCITPALPSSVAGAASWRDATAEHGLSNSTDAANVRLVLGPRGALFGAHNHAPALLLLLEGRKKWYFAPPNAVRRGGVWPGSSADFFAKVSNVAVQRAGEVMVLPDHWWHYVANFERAVGVQLLACQANCSWRRCGPSRCKVDSLGRRPG